jgi:hypothetical protein
MRRLSGLLAAALVAVLVPSTSVASADACDTVMLKSYRLSVDVEDKVYRIGQKAKIHMTVIREQTGTAVSGAMAAVMIIAGREKAVFGVDNTDERGRAFLKVYLSKEYTKPGPVRLVSYAYKQQANVAACATVAEYGFKDQARAFRVTR